MKLEKVKKQIVFSDYDGTIYINEQDMGKTVKAIEKFRSFGGKFVIVTGRSKMSVRNVIERYNIPYDYYISNNGAVIFNQDGEEIIKYPIIPDNSLKVLQYLKQKKNLQIFLYDDDDKVEFQNQELLKIRVKTTDYQLAQNIEDKVNRTFGNFVKAHSAFPGMYYDNHDFVIVDIVSKQAGKENAIKALLEKLKIEKEQATAIGDGRNDIEMIKKYHGYSMETAETEVKEVASQIFKSIVDALEYLEN